MMLTLGIVGVFLLAQFTWSGIALCGAAYFVWKRANASGDEEQFMAALMVLAGLGAVAAVVEAIIARL